MSECKHTRQEAAGYTFTTSAGIWQCPWREIERLRGGLQLIANDKNRLMNEVARQTAASILGGKPIGEVAEWPTREEAEKRAAELMTIGRDTLGENDDWLCFQRPAQPKVTP